MGARASPRVPRPPPAPPRPWLTPWSRAAQLNRYTLMNAASGAAEVKVLSKEQEADTSNFKDKDSGAELEVQEKSSLLEWLANSYKKFGCALEFITNKSQEVRRRLRLHRVAGKALARRQAHAPERRGAAMLQRVGYRAVVRSLQREASGACTLRA